MITSRSLNFLLVILFCAVSITAQSASVSKAVTKVDAQPLGGTVIVTAPIMTTSAGASITVDIQASDTTGQGVTGFDATIQYDSSVIVPVGANAGCSTTGTIFAGVSPLCTNSSNVISVIVFGVSSVSGAGSILRINFQVVGSAGSSSPLTFVTFTFNEGDPMDVTVNGSVTVLPSTAAGTSISGAVMSQTGESIRGVRITLLNQSGETRTAISNGFGFYRFDDIPVGETYLIWATSKRYTFVPQTISVNDEVRNLNLIAEQ